MAIPGSDQFQQVDLQTGANATSDSPKPPDMAFSSQHPAASQIPQSLKRRALIRLASSRANRVV